MIKKIMLILVPLVFLSLCLFFSYTAYRRYTDDYLDVYVASHQLFQRSLIDEEDLELKRVPKEFIGDDIYTDKADILDKYIRLSFSLPKGSLFYKGALEKEIRDEANTLLKEGEVNYDIYTSEVKINTGSLDVGMCVDLYLTINQRDIVESDLLISDARITGLYDSQGKKIQAYDDTKAYIVSLAVGDQHVNILNKALLLGSINVVAGKGTYMTDTVCRLNEDSGILAYLQ